MGKRHLLRFRLLTTGSILTLSVTNETRTTKKVVLGLSEDRQRDLTESPERKESIYGA